MVVRLPLGLLTLGRGLALAIGVVATAAPAQVLSPGPLGKAHAGLEGLGNCTQCHELGKKLDGQKCLACHSDLKAAIDAKRGFHGVGAARNGPCVRCHQDHRGREAALSEWGGARSAFKHASTGFLLDGAHERTACAKCHRADLVEDTTLRARLKTRPESTYLGLGTTCAACHSDVHQGQLGRECKTCHDTRAFKPARFDHASVFKLTGAHARAPCSGCHPAEPQATGPPRVRYEGVSHACASCHRDVHAGKFGARCETCHGTDRWTHMRLAEKDVAFHARTRFPLKGKHAQAPCESCHARTKTQGLVTKGLKFARCADCHLDAHLGQMPTGPDGAVPCEKCHDEDGFFPTRFPLAQHDQSRFPLAGAHQAVACNRCHPPDAEGLAALLPESVKSAPLPRPGNRLVNFTRIRRPELSDQALGQCESCHRDPHDAQFTRAPARACAQCHEVRDFRALRFTAADHELFPLLGEHANVACRACHPAPSDAEGRTGPRGAAKRAVVAWRGAPRACASCHADVHRGQFGAAGCEGCHTPAGFRPTTFAHADPARLIFRLEGQHAALPCERCHPAITTATPGQTKPSTRDLATVRWYRGVPTRCDGCHVDVHADGARRPAATPTRADIPDGDAGPALADCDRCHAPAAWSPVRFDHEATALPLRGRHAEVACRACHTDLRRLGLDPSCSACHRDPHAGRLGRRCVDCHEARSFGEGVGVFAHGRTRFPLYGRHALVPCDQCHVARGDRTFGGLSVRCEACHQADVARTVGGRVDHVAARATTGCGECHNALDWRRAKLVEHERCFPIQRGHHAGITCDECHTSLSGLRVESCGSFTASCTQCHACSRMDGQHSDDGVAGYQCADRKCYECHPNGGEER